MDIKAVTGGQLVEKLDSLGLKSRPASEGSFDYIEEKTDTMDTPISPTLSINIAEQWEKQLMKDPKVCWYLIILNLLALILTPIRIGLHSMLLHNMATMPLPSAQPRSRMYRNSMSRYPLRERPSPTNDLLAVAGSLLPQMFFE